MSFKRHGGLLFWRVGPVGGSLYVKRFAVSRAAALAIGFLLAGVAQ